MVLSESIKRFFAPSIKSLDSRLVEKKGLEGEFVKVRGEIDFCCISCAVYHGKINTGSGLVSFRIPSRRKAYDKIIGKGEGKICGKVRLKPQDGYFIQVYRFECNSK